MRYEELARIIKREPAEPISYQPIKIENPTPKIMMSHELKYNPH